MSKRNRDNERREPSGTEGPASPSVGPVQVMTLIGVGAVLIVSALTWNETQKLQAAFGERVGQVQASVAQLASKVDASARAAAQPRQQGPDPNKVYTIRTSGAPAEGPETAAVTIAEFSDFQ